MDLPTKLPADLIESIKKAEALFLRYKKLESTIFSQVSREISMFELNSLAIEEKQARSGFYALESAIKARFAEFAAPAKLQFPKFHLVFRSSVDNATVLCTVSSLQVDFTREGVYYEV